MVEAAVVLPLVIMTVTALIVLMGFLHGQVVAAAHLQRATLGQAGRSAGTYLVYGTEDFSVSLSDGWANLARCVYGTTPVAYGHHPLLSGGHGRTMEGRSYILDGKLVIRMWDLYPHR